MAYDPYSDVWEDYFNLMNRYWNDIYMPVYFVTQNKSCPCKEVTTIQCGDLGWIPRLKKALQQIDSKYVYVTVEDFFYAKKIDNDQFKKAVEHMEKYNIMYYRLIGYPYSLKNFHGIKKLKCINKRSESGINLQPSIWNRKYLLDIIRNSDYNNPFEFEFAQTLRSRESEGGYFEDCVVDVSKIIDYRNELIKGKHNLFAIVYFKLKGYKINTNYRPVLNIRQLFSYYLRFFGYRIVPNSFKLSTRALLRKFGMVFVDDKFVSNKE